MNFLTIIKSFCLYCKGFSTKDARSREGRKSLSSADILRIRGEKPSSSDADARTFWCIRIFRNLWCVRTDKKGGGSASVDKVEG